MIVNAVLCFGAYALISGFQAKRTTVVLDPALIRLRVIGDTIVQGILSKDVRVILSFEQEDWRAEHLEQLQNRGSTFYCWLVEVNATCNATYYRGERSVLDKLSSARQLRASVLDLGISRFDETRRATVIFYDAANLSERVVNSKTYFCSPKGYETTEAWTFKLVDGRWLANSYVFNNASERC